MEKDLIKQFNLPTYVKGKTYAEASKAIERKFEDRQDQAALETKEELLGRLAKAQEYTKMQEALAANSQEVPDMMDGQIPAGMEEFMPQTNQAFLGGMFGAEGLEAMKGADPTEAIGSMVGAGQQIFGNPNLDTSGQTAYDEQASKNSTLQGAIGGAGKAIKGALQGNPLDVVTGLATGIGSLIGGGKRQKQIEKANQRNYIGGAYAAGRESDFGYGGKMYGYGGKVNSYEDGGDPNDPYAQYRINTPFPTVGSDPANINASAYEASEMTDLSAVADYTAPGSFTPSVDMSGAGTGDYSVAGDRKTTAGKAVDWLGQNFGNIAQYASIVGNLTDKVERPTTARPTKITGRYAGNPIDMNYMTNQVKQATNEQGLASELSGGDLGAARNMATALKLQEARGVADAAYKAQVGERQDKQFGFQMDRQADQFNAMQDERYIERAARDQGAYETARANRRTALFEDIAKIGREEVDKKTIKQMFGYKWNGKYWSDNKGNRLSEKEVQDKAVQAIKEAQQKQAEQNMFGGYLKKK
jgi:hypothetical protein